MTFFLGNRAEINDPEIRTALHAHMNHDPANAAAAAAVAFRFFSWPRPFSLKKDTATGPLWYYAIFTRNKKKVVPI